MHNFSKVKRRTALLLLGAAVIAALSGGLIWATHSESAAPGRRTIQGNYSVDGAKEFARFPLYYAGDSVGGYALTAVEHDTHPAETISFLYGDCTPPTNSEGQYDGGCSPPVSIQVWPACFRNPSLYGEPGTPTPENTTMRGVRAAYFVGGNRLELQTGTSTVFIFANSPASIASALRGLNNSVSTEVDLPVPAAGALTGDLTC